ncbi:hypothetical protein [Couchioplanes caeruleus]|uniref:EF-hand domain-containing protein n=2 Tax=Couchioplanes caeruleus TaxID=56438 RepID=A0A1K0FD75_9ACTN|nr:hypothetical protein [Couchioplanes caeruleus]OJF10789.1 hypothetical protein BG844_30170 [Couchioplanes caeruleus subsp. caeruleus]ROP32235.1 hypothetical protein EDD30_5171 [Couchioplanes caeruleus]
MSDFDAVLERLLTDPAFQAQLARDPGGALAGYTLDSGEVELLHQQVAADPGASQAAVEDRVSKSSTFGLFGSFGGIGALTDNVGSQSGPQPVAVPADGAAGIGPGTGSADPWSAFGAAAGQVAHGVAGQPATEGFGAAPGAWGTGGGVPAQSGLGSAPGLDAGPSAVSGFGDAPHGRAQAEELRAPKGYVNRVDADGDGRIDEATYRGHRGGGAEVLVDLNGDGKTDFIGVDKDLDRIVDYADYDNDHDGKFEERMYDDDGDGWLDRSVRR